MAESPPIQAPPPTGSPNIERLGDVRTGPLPLLYSGPPLHVTSTLPRRMGAAIRDNWFGALVESPSGPTFVEEGFDGVAAANATSFAEDRWWLSQARNRQEFQILAQHAEQRRRDRVVAMENPVTHFLFSAGLDPSNLVTAGSAWVRAGTTVGQRFARGAATGGFQMGALETLHGIADPSIPMSDNIQAVVGAGMFGGLIGTIMRPTRPAAVALGRYIDGAHVDAANLGRDTGPSFLRSDRLAGEAEGAVAQVRLGARSEEPVPAAGRRPDTVDVRQAEPAPAAREPTPAAQAPASVSRESIPAAAAPSGTGGEGVTLRAPVPDRVTGETPRPGLYHVAQDLVDAGRTGQPIEVTSRVADGAPSARTVLDNPLIVKAAEGMQQVVEMLRPIAREIAVARAKLGPDATIDLDAVLPRLSAILHANGHDGLVMPAAGARELRDAATEAVRKTGGTEAHELERILERMIPDDHPQVTMVDRSAQLFAPGVENPVAHVRSQLGIAPTAERSVTIDRPSIGRIALADDWGTGAQRAAGAAGTPAAQVTQTGEFQPLPTGLGLERLGMSPQQRLITSPIDAVGDAITRLSSIPYQIARNLKGRANPANVDSDQLHWKSRLAHVNREYDEAFQAHRGVGGAFIAMQELAGTTAAGKLTAAQFRDAVWERLHGQADHAVPEINRAAAAMRKLYDEMGDAAATARVPFFDQATVRKPKVWHTAMGDITEGYVNRVWNTAFIQKNLAAFTREVEHWLQISGGNPARASEIVEGILTDRPFRAIDDEHVGQATSSYKRAFDAPSTHFARWLITDPKELISVYTRTMGVDISLVNHAGGVNAKPLIDNAMEEWMREIGRRAGTDGQAAFDDLQKQLSRISADIQKEYKILEENARIYGNPAGGHTPSLADIALIRDRGLAQKEAAMQNARAQLQAPDDLWAHMHGDLDDLKATRDLLRGTYGQWDDSMDWVPRVLASARKIGMMTGLTGVVSQLSDVGALVLKEGLTRTLGTAIALLRSDMATIKMAMHEAQLMGTAIDMMSAGQAMAIHDLAPSISGRHTMVERAIDKATEASFYINLMNPWTAYMKGAASLVVGSRMLEDVNKVAGQAMRGIDLQGRVVPGGVIAQHAAISARLDELWNLQDGRTVGYVPTAADQARWAAEAQQLTAQRSALPPLSRPEAMAVRVEHERLLSTTSTLFPNGRTTFLGHASEVAQRQAELDRFVAGHEQAMARLARAGVDPDMAVQIAAQLNTHGTTRDGVLHLPNTERWSHSDARTAYRRAVAEDVENAVISGDKVGRSLWLSTPFGQTLGMFHAYGQATIQKLLIPALQEKDSRLIAGVALMVGAGIVSDQLRRLATGNTQPDTSGEALLRGIERSGVLGWFGNLFNAANNMTDNRFGPGFAGAPHQPGPAMPMALANASPDGMIRALGPVASRSRDLIDLTFRTATMDWGSATARDARRLLPLNNVTHLHFAFTQFEHLLAGRGAQEPAVAYDTSPRRTRAAPVPAASAPAAAAGGSPGMAVPAAAPMPPPERPRREPRASQLRGPPPAAAQPQPY